MKKLLDQMTRRMAGPPLTQARVVTVLAIAALADLLQIVLVPLQWMFIQQIIDVVAMILTMAILGFHILLLPTFIIELVPVADMLPTWTGCVIAVIALRKRAAKAANESSNSPKKLRDEPPLTEI